ncbi:MAG TPA: hopanoid-associated sugar epimerase [Alphaproteobacteria bacterium]|nr:hopanoid-associated sugar epimerase [Alphaproteobacteria bacterium]
MKALVTGASGFIGFAVARRLTEAGHGVRALLRPTSERRYLDTLACECVTGSLADTASLAAALAGCDALFHVAADYRLWVPEPAEIYRTNVDGTRNIMRAALAEGVGRIVYTSSVATLGLTPDASPADEETPSRLEDMIGHYKRSKFLAEAEVKRMIREEGLRAVIVNPSAPIGPYDVRPTPTGKMVVDAASGRMPAYVDTGLNVVHVDDVAAGHLLAFERGKPGERYILGGENMTLREILTEVTRLAGRSPPRLRLPHELVLPIAYVAEAVARLTGRAPMVTVDGVKLAKKFMYFSSDKARRELGYAWRPARAAIADAVDWFRRNGYLGRAP